MHQDHMTVQQKKKRKKHASHHCFCQLWLKTANILWRSVWFIRLPIWLDANHMLSSQCYFLGERFSYSSLTRQSVVKLPHWFDSFFLWLATHYIMTQSFWLPFERLFDNMNGIIWLLIHINWLYLVSSGHGSVGAKVWCISVSASDLCLTTSWNLGHLICCELEILVLPQFIFAYFIQFLVA